MVKTLLQWKKLSRQICYKVFFPCEKLGNPFSIHVPCIDDEHGNICLQIVSMIRTCNFRIYGLNDSTTAKTSKHKCCAMK
jgi:hypothetical protein